MVEITGKTGGGIMENHKIPLEAAAAPAWRGFLPGAFRAGPRAALVLAFFALALLQFTPSASAEVPTKFNYQGNLRQGGFLISGTRDMVFRVFSSSTSMAPLWTSVTLPVHISTGVFRVSLEPVISDWQTGSLWLELEIEGVKLSPREEITSTPYSINTLMLSGKRYTNTATAPVNPVLGELWMDTLQRILKIWNGITWEALSGAGSVIPHAPTHAGNGSDAINSLGPFTLTGALTMSAGTSITSGPGSAAVTVSTNLVVNGSINPWSTLTLGGPGYGVNIASSVSAGWFYGSGLEARGAPGESRDMIMVSTGASNVIRMTSDGYIYANRFIGDVSGAQGLPQGDNLGNHTAVQALNMAGYQVINVSSLTVTGKDPGGYSLWLSSGINMAGGTVNAGRLIGNGAAVTALNASSLAAGTVPDARLSGNVVMTNNAQTITGLKTFSSSVTVTSALGVSAPAARLAQNVSLSSASAAFYGGVYVSSHIYTPGNVYAAKIYGDVSSAVGLPQGDNLGNHTAIQALNMAGYQVVNVSSLTVTGKDPGGYSLWLSSGLNMAGGTVNAGLYRGSGAALTGLNASALASGTVPDARLSANVDLLSAAQTLTGVKTFASSVTVTNAAGASLPKAYLNPNVEISSTTAANYGGVYVSSHIYTPGNVYAAKIYGDISDAQGLPQGDNLGNHTAVQALNMAGYQVINVSSLTVTGRDPGGYSLWLSSGLNMAGGTVNAGLYRGSGAGLADLDASALASGTVPDARLSSNVDLLNVSQTLTGVKTFASSVTVTNAAGAALAKTYLSPNVEISSTTAGYYGGVYVSSHIYTPGNVYAAKIYGDVSGAVGLPQGDNLGNHTAIQPLNLAGRDIFNASTVTAAAVQVSSAAGYAGDMVLISTGGSNVIRMTGDGSIFANKFYGDVSGAVGLPQGDNLGNHTAVLPLNLAGRELFNASTVTAAAVRVSSAAGYAGDMVVVSTGGSSVIRMTGDGSVYANRFYGDVSGAVGLPQGDNLGNHTAVQALDMAGRQIMNVSSLTVAGSGFSVGGSTLTVRQGRVGIGSADPAAPLDVNGAVLLNAPGYSGTSYFGTGITVGDAAGIAQLNWGVSQAGTAGFGGNLGAGTLAPASRLDVANGSVTIRGAGAALVLENSSRVISPEASAALGAGIKVSTNVYIVGFSSAAKYYGDGSSLTNVPGDNWGTQAVQRDASLAGNGTAALPLGLTGQGLALHNLATSGLISRTGAGVVAGRTITAGSSKIGIANGDGVDGNPAVDVNEANLNLNNIGGTLSVGKGGTGATELTGILKGNGTAPVTALTGTQNYAARWTNATTLGTGVIYDDNASVGIGLDAPDQRLTVAGNISQTGVLISSGTGNNYFAGNLGLGVAEPSYRFHNAGDSYIEGQEIIDGALTVRGSVFSVDTAALAVSGGQVGVGTDSPLQKLQVAGDINIEAGSGVRINNTAASGQYLRGDGTRFVQDTIKFSDLPAFGGTPALTLGTVNAAGAALTYIRTDATILAFDGATPPALGLAAAGSAGVAARRDHVHPSADLATGQVTGLLPLTKGGTNDDLSGAAQGGVIYKAGSSLAATGQLTGVVKGNGAGAPTAMTGTQNYAARWTAEDTLGTGVLTDNGTRAGVGTASPDQELTVAGDISQTGLLISSGAGNNYFAGNLGVGAVNPLQKLQVAGDINIEAGSGVRINNTAAAGLYLRGDGTRFAQGAIQTGDLPHTVLGAVPALTLGTANAEGSASTYIRSDATLLTFDAVNPVELGTAGPGAAAVAARRDHAHPAADLATGQVTGILTLDKGGTNDDLSGAAQGGFIYKGASALAASGQLAGVVRANGAGVPTAMTGTQNYAARWTANDTIGTGALTDNGTRVGVGTTSPDQELTVAGDISQSGLLISSGAGNNYFAGNLGVGAANPLQKLQVAGDINIESGSGVRINNTAAAGLYLRGDGTRFAQGAIQTGDLPHTLLGAVPALTLGTANAEGSASTYIRSDATILAFNAVSPEVLGAASAGTGGVAARSNHAHPSADLATGQVTGILTLDKGGTNDDLSGAAQGGFIYKGASALAASGQLAGVVRANGAGVPTAMTGTQNYAARWTANDTIGTGALTDNGTRVGVGTTSPDQELTVAGDISQSGLLISSGAGNNYFAGKLGLGAVNPLQKLQVAGDINIESGSGVRINNTAASGQYLRGDGTRFAQGAIQTGDLPHTVLGAAPALTLGTANAEGSASTYVRTDATLLTFDAVNPVALGTAGPGAAAVAARRDHTHPAADLATGQVTGVLPLTKGGTSKNLTAAAGGLVWSDADSLEITAALTGVVKANGAGAPTAMTGTQNYAARWTANDTLGTGALYDNGASVGVGTANPAYQFHNTGALYTEGQAIVGGTLTVKGATLGVGGLALTVSNGNWKTSSGNFIEDAALSKPVFTSTIYGGNGDLPFRTSANAPVTMRAIYGPFSYGMPSCPAGSVRNHKLYAEFVDNIQGGGQHVFLRIAFDGGVNRDFDLGSTWGDSPAFRTYVSSAFTEANAAHASVQLWVSGTNGPYAELRKAELQTFCTN
ncbi:MAG TPA: hypothetical protein DEQ38_14135 [Elusimicrobia bacterium]|nr:hypothetical protein [Elusimicrobiota bacterium]